MTLAAIAATCQGRGRATSPTTGASPTARSSAAAAEAIHDQLRHRSPWLSAGLSPPAVMLARIAAPRSSDTEALPAALAEHRVTAWSHCPSLSPDATSSLALTHLRLL